MTNIKSYDFPGYSHNFNSVSPNGNFGGRPHGISGFAVRPQMFAARNAATWSGALLHVRVSEQAAGIERDVLWIQIASPIVLSPSAKAS